MKFFFLFLLLFSLSFSFHLKVLYEDGKVGVVEEDKLSLLRDVVYVEPAFELEFLDDIVYSSSVAVLGDGNRSFSIKTYNNQRLSLILGGGSVSYSGSCTGSFDNLLCSEGVLNLSVSSSSSWRLVVQSFGKNLKLSDFSAPAYYLGTGAANAGRSGRGVLIGIVDSGVDWCHPAFRRQDGSSRILFYYVVRTQTEYTRSQIEEFIRQGRCEGDYDGHGTYVAGVATYIAKDADLVVVEIRPLDTEVMLGLEYLRGKKDRLRRPMVVNLSLGTNRGPHDGTSMLEAIIAELSGAGFVVVAAAGNSGNKRVHAKIENLSFPTDVPFRTGGGDFVDGWYKNGTLRVEVCSPMGNSCLGANPGEVVSGYVAGCNLTVDNSKTSHPLNGDGNFTIEPACGGERLTIKLTPIRGNPKVDMYAEGYGEFEAYYLEDGTGGYLGTVLTPASSPKAIAVGAISSRFTSTSNRSFLDLGRIAYFSSRGPNRKGMIKPEVTAPGFFVLVPLARSQEFVPRAGTSMSSPIVAGLVALILEGNPNLTVEEIRNVLTSQALSDGFTGPLPNNIYGYGKAFLGSTPSGDGGGGGSVGGGGGGGCTLGPKGSTWLSVVLLLVFVSVRRLRR